MSTTSSELGSVPTNLACVTASAMFSIAVAELSVPSSVYKTNENLLHIILEKMSQQNGRPLCEFYSTLQH